MNTQKQAHNNNMKKAEELRVPYTFMPLWWVGMAGVILGAIGDFIAVGLANQSLAVASGGATVLLCNCVVAKVWHKEELSVQTFSGVLCIVAGAIIFAIPSPPAKEYRLEELATLARSSSFLIFIAVQVTIVLIMLAGIHTSSAHHGFKRAYRPLIKKIEKKIDNKTKKLVEQNERMEIRLKVLEDGTVIQNNNPIIF